MIDDLEAVGTLANPSPIATGDQMRHWIDFADPGDWARYWTGDLAGTRDARSELERAKSGISPARLFAARNADQLAKVAWGAYVAGDVILVQRRNSRGFSYLAVRTKRRLQ